MTKTYDTAKLSRIIAASESRDAAARGVNAAADDAAQEFQHARQTLWHVLSKHRVDWDKSQGPTELLEAIEAGSFNKWPAHVVADLSGHATAAADAQRRMQAMRADASEMNSAAAPLRTLAAACVAWAHGPADAMALPKVARATK
jgi:hypothetical protein